MSFVGTSKGFLAGRRKVDMDAVGSYLVDSSQRASGHCQKKLSDYHHPRGRIASVPDYYRIKKNMLKYDGM